ncbi:MAG: molybdenum cofactor synthesis domain-containing protein, partial [Halobacteria archaeon]|nr:molybdenum cofactor synthesis domain-containing protein [Halobacteria archaeon]
GAELSRGQIYDVNSFTVAAAVEEAGVGGEAVVYEHVGDDYDEMRHVLARASDECDIVVSSGSTSASEADVLYEVVEDEGELLLHGIAVKPGRPTILGRIDGTPYVGLPGNPISALMVFHYFGSRIVRDAAGLSGLFDEKLDGETANRIDSRGGRTRLLPVGLVESPERGLLAYSLDRGSGATTSLGEADGYVVIDADTNYLEKREEVEVNLFDSDSASDVPPSIRSPKART